MGELSTPGASWADARARALARLGDAALDRAPAGGVDAAAAPLVGAINGRAAYATTSTCAGRCAVYAAPAGAGRKRRGRWLFVSHDGVAGAAVGRAVAALAAEATAWPAGERWTVSLKFEPPIAHVRCATLAAARRLVRVCHASGWRETGCNLADVPTVAVRSTGAALDCPLGEVARDGARHVPSAERLDFLAAEAARRLAAARVALDGLARAVASELGDDAGPGAAAAAAAAVVVPRARAKAVKSALEARGGFDKNFSVAPAGAGGALAIPLTRAGLRAVEARDPGVEAALAGAAATVVAAPDLPPSRAARRKAGRRPSLADLLRDRSTAPASDRLRWTRLGDDAVLVPPDVPVGDGDGAFWARVARAAGASRVFRDAEIAPDGFRSSRRVLLHGPGGPDASWVVVREAGVAYGFDATHTMFARGNGSERMRFGALDARGETVVDLYAGVGYFALPLLCRAGVAFAHCCEWAPAAVAALRRNLAANGVAESRYAIHVGDSSAVAPALGRVADRVSLGLTPSSRRGWRAACAVLKDRGGVLHVHENVRVPAGSAAADRARFEDGAAASRRAWRVLCARPGGRLGLRLRPRLARRLRAARVHHLVADVACRPRRPPESPGATCAAGLGADVLCDLSDYCAHSESFSVLHRVRQHPVGVAILTEKLRVWGGGPRGVSGSYPASGNELVARSSASRGSRANPRPHAWPQSDV